MAPDTIFSCSNCDAQFPKWSGRCLECGAWGSLKEGVAPVSKARAKSAVRASVATVSRLQDVPSQGVKRLTLSKTPGVTVFPKGMPLGGVILLSGEPGAGKSTLALQLLQCVPEATKVLYVSAEEGASQIRERAERIGGLSGDVLVTESSDTDEIIATLEGKQIQVVVIDSLQLIQTRHVDSEPGSISQIRASSSLLTQAARSRGVTVILIGHVTKDGALAGPKALEHLVDAVYYLESDRRSSYRLLRCFKNRFGETGTIGVFQHTGSGLKIVQDSSMIFIHAVAEKPGSAVTITEIEGQLFFVEVQSLVSKSSFGYAKRAASGFSKSRLELLLAIMKKNLKIDFDSYDVYVNIAGGFSVHEPAMDLAVAASILSSFKEEPLPKGAVVFGEVGLSGEIRPVKNTAARLKEINRHKFQRAILPPLESKVKSDMTLMPFAALGELVKALKW